MQTRTYNGHALTRMRETLLDGPLKDMEKRHEIVPLILSQDRHRTYTKPIFVKTYQFLRI